MKKVLVMLLVFIIGAFYTKPFVIHSYTGFKEYHELSNGQWQCEDEIYPYKLEFYDETKDYTYIVLSHNKDAEYQIDDLDAAILSSVVPYELDHGKAIVVEMNYHE